MTAFYKITIQYRGQGFQGWQIQPKGRTLQGELNTALRKITKSDEITSLASGRTDSGVHAQAQVVKISLPFHIPAQNLRRAINSNIHCALNVTKIEEVGEDFHPIRDAKSKEYRYFFTGSDENALFIKDFVTVIHNSLDIELMQKAASLFVGKHDFVNFHTTGSDPRSTIREVLEVEIVKVQEDTEIPLSGSNIYYMRIRGKGFLKQMVRAIMGSVWAVGSGQSTLEELESSLKCQSNKRIGAVVPAQGLHLWRVWY